MDHSGVSYLQNQDLALVDVPVEDRGTLGAAVLFVDADFLRIGRSRLDT